MDKPITPITTNCFACGRQLISKQEFAIGVCEVCINAEESRED